MTLDSRRADLAPWRAAPLAGLGAAAAAAGVVLVLLGPAVPGPPWSRSEASWAAWAAAVGPAGVVMGLVRILALVAVGYLLVVVVLELGGRRSAIPALLRTSHRLCLPGMAAWLSQAAAAGLVVSVVAGSALSAGTASAATRPPGTVVMHELPPTTSAGPATVTVMPATRPEPRADAQADAPRSCRRSARRRPARRRAPAPRPPPPDHPRPRR